jgi:AraC-like DNA-binding protein
MKAAPGGLLIVDPLLTRAAVDDALAGAARFAFDVVLYLSWDSGAGETARRVLDLGRPLDVLISGVDDDPARVEALVGAVATPTACVETLWALRDMIHQVPVYEIPVVVEPFLSGRNLDSVKSLVVRHGLQQRSVERHLANAGLAAPRAFIRAGRVARAREMMARSGILREGVGVAEACGFPSSNAMLAAFRWAVGSGPTRAAANLTTSDFAARLAQRLVRPAQP